MKRNSQVLNAREVRAGRKLIRWGARGVLPRALLGRGPAFAAAFARAVEMAAPVTKADVAHLIRAAYFGPAEAERMASEWEHWADEKEAQLIEWGAESPYDLEVAKSYRRLAAAIRAAGSITV